MEAHPFTAAVRSAGAGACVLALAGPLDAQAEPALSDAHNRTRSLAARVVAVDAGGLSSLDGAGLALLVKLWAWASAEGQELRLWGLGERCAGLLRELGLARALPVFPSEGAALAGSPRGPAAGGGGPCPAASWAGALGRARLPAEGQGAHRLNVDGLRVQGPLQGFGQLWHKTYRARLAGAAETPVEVARILREELPGLWPEGNRLHLPPPGVVPGAVGAIHLTMPGGVPLATGVRVLHAGELSFTLATLEGHLQAGWITFGAYEGGGCTVAQVQSLGRTGDPLYELGFRLFGHGEQERFWRATLEALGRRLGVPVRVESTKERLDPGLNWAAAGNLWHNAGVRTGLEAAASLLRRALSPGRR